MQNRSQMIVGGFLVIIGLLFLVSTLLDIDLGVLCWPVFLIALGVWLLWRPRLERAGKRVNVQFFGDIHRRGQWTVASEDFWILIGDVDLDMVQTEVPEGEHVFQIYSLIGDVDLYVPMGIGVSVRANALIGDTRLMGIKETSFLTPIEFTSPDYASSKRRVRLDIWCLIGDIKAQQVSAPYSGSGESLPL